MKYDPEIHHRRSIRMKGHDYTGEGLYFVTVCVEDRDHLFGEVVDQKMQLNELGNIVADAWRWLAIQYQQVELDTRIIMPNHLHGIIAIIDPVGRGGSRTAPTKAKPMGRLMGAIKTVSSKQINGMRGTPGETIWQRNYYEHIVRNRVELERIREYILTNPANWEKDCENQVW